MSSSGGAAAGAGAAGASSYCCGCCWSYRLACRRATRPDTAVAVPATTAVRVAMRSSPMVLPLVNVSGAGDLAGGYDGLHDVDRDADLIDHHRIGGLACLDDLGRPQIFDRDEQRRTVRR